MQQLLLVMFNSGSTKNIDYVYQLTDKERGLLMSNYKQLLPPPHFL
jgi:glutamine cyclotransferase